VNEETAERLIEWSKELHESSGHEGGFYYLVGLRLEALTAQVAELKEQNTQLRTVICCYEDGEDAGKVINELQTRNTKAIGVISLFAEECNWREKLVDWKTAERALAALEGDE
jgi:hypothetical protein